MLYQVYHGMVCSSRRPPHGLPLDDMVPILDVQDGVDDFLMMCLFYLHDYREDVWFLALYSGLKKQ
mgnify:CR=1 FL=1